MSISRTAFLTTALLLSGSGCDDAPPPPNDADLADLSATDFGSPNPITFPECSPGGLGAEIDGNNYYVCTADNRCPSRDIDGDGDLDPPADGVCKTIQEVIHDACKCSSDTDQCQSRLQDTVSSSCDPNVALCEFQYECVPAIEGDAQYIPPGFDNDDTRPDREISRAELLKLLLKTQETVDEALRNDAGVSDMGPENEE
jgi:hypothetical protein